MIVAIYGPSRVGKTMLASRVAAQLGVPVRHCGEAIKRAALERGMPLSDVPLDLHTAVDDETRRFARTTKPIGIVEGRFLKYILGDRVNVRFVRLSADQDVRALRRSEHQARQVDAVASVYEEDAVDARLVSLLYGGKPSQVVSDWLEVDTTKVLADDAVSAVIDRIRREDVRWPRD